MLKTPSYPEYGMNENKTEYRKAVNQPIITTNAHTEGSFRNLGRDLGPSKALAYIGCSSAKLFTCLR